MHRAVPSKHCGNRLILLTIVANVYSRFYSQTIWEVVVRINSFASKSDQLQNSSAASPEILHHTVWRTWHFIAYSDERWLQYQFSLPHLYISLLEGWENVLFRLESERVNTAVQRPFTVFVFMRRVESHELTTMLALFFLVPFSSCPDRDQCMVTGNRNEQNGSDVVFLSIFAIR